MATIDSHQHLKHLLDEKNVKYGEIRPFSGTINDLGVCNKGDRQKVFFGLVTFDTSFLSSLILTTDLRFSNDEMDNIKGGFMKNYYLDDFLYNNFTLVTGGKADFDITKINEQSVNMQTSQDLYNSLYLKNHFKMNGFIVDLYGNPFDDTRLIDDQQGEQQ